MKFAVIVNKEFLTGLEGSAPNLQQESPLFDYEGVPGKWLVPISIPYKQNCIKLGLPSEPTVVDSDIEYECKLLIHDTWLIGGTLTIFRSDGNQIEISVACPYYDITDDLLETSIRELAWDDILLDDPNETQVYVDIIFTNVVEAEDDIVINTSYDTYNHHRDPGETLSTMVGEIVSEINVDTDASGIEAEGIAGNTVRLKQVEMGAHNHIFDTTLISASSGGSVTIVLDFMSWLTDWHDTLSPYLNGLGDAIYPDTHIQWPLHKNAEHYGDLNADFTGFINEWDGTDYLINYSTTEAFTGNKYTLVPMIFLMAVVKKIFDTAQIQISGYGVETEKFKRVIIDNNYSIGKEWYDPDSENTYISFADRIHHANHLPEMTVGEFLNAYRTKFNLYFDYDPNLRKLEIKWRDELFNVPVRNNWMDKKWKGRPIDEFKSPDGIKFSSPKDTGDDFAGIYPAFHDTSILQQDDYKVGNGELEITSAFTHPSMQLVFDIDVIEKKMPVKSRPGSGDEWEERRNSFSPALLIFAGFHDGHNQIFATNDQLDTYGASTGLGISLIWDECYEIFWTKWATFVINSAQRRVVAAVLVSDIMNFEFDEWYAMFEKDWLCAGWEIVEITDTTIFVEFTLHRQKNFF